MTLALLEADASVVSAIAARAIGHEPCPVAVAEAQEWLRAKLEGAMRRLVRILPTTATGIGDLRKSTPLGGPWYPDVAAAHAAADRDHRGLFLTIEAEVPVEAIDWEGSLVTRLGRGESLQLHAGAGVTVVGIGYGRRAQKRYPCRAGLIGRTMTV